MKAAVLLCLLEATVLQAQNFNWDGLRTTNQPMTTRPNAGNPCADDQASCSCCLMKQKVKNMETQWQTIYDNYQQDLDALNKVVEKIAADRSAFSATLKPHNNIWCIGPQKQVIIFQHVFLNLGNMYDSATGIFTTTQAGVYSFSLTIYKAVRFDRAVRTCADLTVNGRMVAVSKQNYSRDLHDSGTITLALELKKGDTVAAVLSANCTLCEESPGHYNTFSGFLLYPL